MSTITHLMPKIGDEGARRLSHCLHDMLATIEQGVDPGPRGPAIHSLGLSITQLVTKLRSELGELGVAGNGTAVDEFLRELSATADDAVAYWSPHP